MIAINDFKTPVPDRVDAAAARVQFMQPLRRALLAREGLILSADSVMVVGPAEKRLRKILAVIGRWGLAPISLALLGRRFLAGRRASTSAGHLPEVLFVGIDALRERQLRADLAAETGHLPMFVDQRNADGFSPLPAPGSGRVLRHWRRILAEAWAILDEPDPDFATMDVLASLAIRAHDLAYLLALFEALHDSRPDMRIVCSTADLASHAACIAGFSTEYHQHGLLGRALVFPGFSRMVALTGLEGRHVAACLPGLDLRVATRQAEPAKQRRVLAMAGDYSATDPDPVTALIELALFQGYEVVVRPHPRGYESLWSGIIGREGVMFESEGSFEDFLAKWRPAFVASWFSTTLLDGLMKGAVPVTLTVGQKNLVLPLDKIALAFPEDRLQLDACMQDAHVRSRMHETLFNEVMA